MKYSFASVCLLVLLLSSATTSDFKNKSGSIIKTRFNAPAGYSRIETVRSSFAGYLQSHDLKPDGSKVHYYNGGLKDAEVHEAVLNVDVGKRDLQQCADAIMRLRSEYLYSMKQYDKIHFNFTNGFKADYKKWAEGYRIKVSGNNVSWHKAKGVSYSYEDFRKYLDVVFTYAGTLSLDKELKTVSFKNMQIGDVLIVGGSPGHAVIVVDMASDAKGNKLYMLAQSYMPAQEIHILKNYNNAKISPWYEINNISMIKTPEWTFSQSHLKRFAD